MSTTEEHSQLPSQDVRIEAVVSDSHRLSVQGSNQLPLQESDLSAHVATQFDGLVDGLAELMKHYQPIVAQRMKER